MNIKNNYIKWLKKRRMIGFIKKIEAIKIVDMIRNNK